MNSRNEERECFAELQKFPIGIHHWHPVAPSELSHPFSDGAVKPMVLMQAGGTCGPELRATASQSYVN